MAKGRKLKIEPLRFLAKKFGHNVMERAAQVINENPEASNVAIALRLRQEGKWISAPYVGKLRQAMGLLPLESYRIKLEAHFKNLPLPKKLDVLDNLLSARTGLQKVLSVEQSEETKNRLNAKLHEVENVLRAMHSFIPKEELEERGIHF